MVHALFTRSRHSFSIYTAKVFDLALGEIEKSSGSARPDKEGGGCVVM